MATKIPIPRLGQTEETVTIQSWKVKEGDTIKKGDVLFDVETDKSVLDVESQFEGTVLKILVPAGKEVPVQTIGLIIGLPGEDITALVEPITISKGSLVEGRCQRCRRNGELKTRFFFFDKLKYPHPHEEDEKLLESYIIDYHEDYFDGRTLTLEYDGEKPYYCHFSIAADYSLSGWQTILRDCHEGDIVQAEIIAKTRDGLIAKFFNFDAILPLKELDLVEFQEQLMANADEKLKSQLEWGKFREPHEFIGQVVKVKILKIDPDRHMVIVASCSLFDWIQQECHEGDIVEAQIIEKTKDELIAKFFDFDAILPLKELDLDTFRKPKDFVGQTIKVKILKIYEDLHKVVVSRKYLTSQPETTEKREKQKGLADEVKALRSSVEKMGRRIEQLETELKKLKEEPQSSLRSTVEKHDGWW